MFGFRVAACGAVLALTACAMTITEPVVVIGDKGQILRGTVTASLSGGSFTATDGKLTCGGGYDSLDTSLTISMAVLCSDGRRGSGTVRLSDGSTATFMFGTAAASF